MKTYSAKPEDIVRKWYVVDADGQTLGRLATRIAEVLRGKHKAIFTPHMDTGDYVIVINAEKIHVTGSRLDQKMYYRYSGYPGGLRSANLRQVLQKDPERPIKEAVKGMLPKGPLGRDMLRKLRVYAGPEHPHEAQEPEVLEIETRG
ncbi:MAG: 50S ribosomal protein L13 [Chloroflexi bacterium]|nr:50S ribosomal protein L13 [Chloroflexota bacterium]